MLLYRAVRLPRRRQQYSRANMQFYLLREAGLLRPVGAYFGISVLFLVKGGQSVQGSNRGPLA